MRWVIKVGSGVISTANGVLDRDAIKRLASQLIGLHQQDNQVILVSSGAIAAGVGRLGLTERPTDLRMKQSAAAVGQLALLKAYEEYFSEAQIIPAQILLTREDLLDRDRYFNIRNTLMNLLALRTIPIINENDSVSVEEIQFGDNDTLAAIVAVKVGADRLILLSNVPGLYQFGTEEDGKKIVSVVHQVTAEMEMKASKKIGSKLSVGGIVSKLRAAKMAASAGIETWIASGHESNTLERILRGEEGVGTRFVAKKMKVPSRHAWIAFGRSAKGSVTIDDGAVDALVKQKKSLLPKGIKVVKGHFLVGDTIEVRSAEGMEIGRGLVNYSALDVKKIKGHHSKDIGDILGRQDAVAEVIHRDNLVLL